MKNVRNFFFVMVGLCLFFGMTNLAMAAPTVTSQHELKSEDLGGAGDYGVSLFFTIENAGTESLSDVTLEIVDVSIPAPLGITNIMNLGDLSSGETVQVYWNIGSLVSVSGNISTILINGNGTDVYGIPLTFTINSVEVVNE